MYETLALDGGYVGGIAGVAGIDAATGIQRQRAAVDTHEAVALQGFCAGCCSGDGQGAILDVDVAGVLAVVVGGFAGRFGAVETGLDAIVAHAADVQRAALEEEVFVAVDTILHGREDVDGAVLHLHVLF